MEINRYIDFKGLFAHLIKEHKDDLRHVDRLAQFVAFDGHNDYELISEDSQFTDKYIVFAFGKYLEIAHEGSSGYVASANYDITYDREKEMFVNCEYEQG